MTMTDGAGAPMGASADDTAHPDGWTPERTEALRAAWDAGRTYAQIADMLGITRAAVAGKVTRMQRAGDLPTRFSLWSPAEDAAIVAGYAAGDCLATIAKALGRTKRAVSHRVAHLRRAGYVLAPSCDPAQSPVKRRPSYRPQPTFWTPERDAELLATREAGLSYAQAAEQMGITHHAISARVQKLRRRGVAVPAAQPREPAPKRPRSVKPRPRPENANPWGTTIVPELAAGVASRAAQFLRRLGPVHNCGIRLESSKGKTIGDALGLPNRGRDHWKWNGQIIPSEELIASARRKGFDPDAWKALA